jgi:glycosyltransferase involved in cell wall biosynthesis
MEGATYSIVIPIFNEEDTLPHLLSALAGVMAQLDAPAEVVLVDDGSRDTSYRLMVEANAQDPRFKYCSCRGISGIRSQLPLEWTSPLVRP